MSKIILDVNSSDVKTVLTILNNLKSGLIKNIQTEEKSSKYISKDVYNEMKEDKATISTSKYVSPSEFKNRIKKKVN